MSLESAESLKAADLERLRQTGASIIISYHDFTSTNDLDAIYDRIRPFAPDFFKIVPTAKSLTDNVTLMRFLER